MLLLVTILLVLVAAVTLLIGIFSDELALIFISIGASALAAIVLAVLSQVSRRRGRAASTATGPEPLPARTPAPSPVPAPAAATPSPAAPPAEEEVGADEAPTEVVPVAAVASTGSVPLPIGGYDTLRVNEILPKLEGLDLDQLEDVAQHEEAHKNRTTVLNRIDQLMDELEAAEAGTTAPVAAAPVVETDEVSDDVVEEAAASIEEIGEPVVAPVTSAAGDGFPIPGYDGMSEDELIPLLDSLDADQLEKVADREEAGPNRDAVLDAIDDRLDILEGIVPAPPAKAAAPAPAPAPAKKAPAKKAVAKKAASAPAPAKKAAAKNAAAAAAPAKKAPAKKAAANTTAKKVAAPAKKAPAATTAKKTAAKKTAATVKKATPVKKATAAKKATKR